MLSLKLVRRRRSCWRRAGAGVAASAGALDGVGVGVGEDIGRWMVVQVRCGVLGPFRGLLCGGVGRLSIIV